MSSADRELAVPDYSRAFVDKKGEAILIKTLGESMCQRLIAMYLDYQPKDSFDGLPPIKDAVCVEWVQGMIHDGINLVALASEENIVGHAALFPIDGRRCEILMAISPPYQNVGIGTELTRSSVELARELGFRQVWLSVESRNARARHVYKKCGFECCSVEEQRDIDMRLDLR